MVSKLFGVFKDSNEKQIKRYRWVIDEVNELEPEFQALSDDSLRAKTEEFRGRIDDGDTLDDLLPEAFAAAREAAVRSLGMRHFDVQLIGGAVLHEGKVAEMKTGEGKTLVATLATYLNALGDGGVHVVTVNDYLARRDSAWMGAVYHALGMSIGCLQHEASLIYDVGASGEGAGPDNMRPCSRKEAYEADITYGTNNEFGFDYLRDNMATDKSLQVQTGLAYAIVDEVDNILIDEARTPLIISGQADEPTSLYQTISQVVPRLIRDEDYYIEEKERQAMLTDAGITKLEKLLNIENLYDPENSVVTHYVENGLRAHAIYLRDKDYVVEGGEVVIVDEFTGRKMTGRRYGEGLHQAIEAKEGVKIQRETVTYATVTLQNYFRMYDKLSGMTGTAMTEAEEFFKVYNLEVMAIPTHRAMVRQDYPDLVYKTAAAKLDAVVEQIQELHASQRPMLIGSGSIEHSELLSEMLQRRGVKHEVLNAKNHEREAEIVANAGKPGAVTVSTNMAGRGTDIVLGGDPKLASSPEQWQADHDAVLEMGGLYVLGTERHESRRIDNQLRGRAGRQGDPGETRFYGSLQDDLMTRFGSTFAGRLVGKALPDDVPIESGMLTKTLEMTQGKVESYFFDIRKHLVDYDDVVNKQREVVYAQRRKVLEGEDLKLNIQEMVGSEITRAIQSALRGDPSDWPVDMLIAEINTIFPLPENLDEDFVADNGRAKTEDAILDAAEALYEEREEQFTADLMRRIERAVMLQIVDRLWLQHLTMMQNLRQGIGLQAYGQRDPLVMYKKEGHEAFEELLGRIRHDIAHAIFHVAPAQQNQQSAAQAQAAKGAPTADANKPGAVDTTKTTTVMSRVGPQAGGPVPSIKKLGRNDICYCGSGKKYKRCHGLGV
ncbi:MAG: preprotein translocase subunit SecA [Chloroflexi bacterium]|nr:preprotein translocase subunit SecA [Chloroflexota bacterium]